MAWPLVLLVVATAAFTSLAARRSAHPSPGDGRRSLRDLLDAGAVALGLLAVAVTLVVLGTGRPDQGAKVAVLGLLSYLVYVAAAAVLTRRR